MTSVEKVRTADLTARLRRHYIKPGAMPGGIFLTECGINGNFGASRRVDALHVGFTNSSGRVLTGHEIKVSRADWQHELDDPAKSDTWADQCHAWYLVTPRGLVDAAEVPTGWGLMVPSSRTTTRMEIVVKAKIHADRTPSWDVVRSIMARLDTLQSSALAEQRLAHRDAIQDEVEKRVAAFRQVQPDIDPQTRTAAAAFRRAQTIMRDSDDWRNPTEDELVEALVDLTKAHAAADNLRQQLGVLCRSVLSASRPFERAHGTLQAIVEQIPAGDS